ncbi:uncharacterized protein LOC124207738 [Daphnia pulex]|uniref:uncharacterized protein LOC124207738 n=1 Tax=Daphnia pulex TaxID=6669 RepID=UPI001EDD2E41|nr:uncharacterized protein LOC124207738 [Daphnia pulex]
MSFDRTREKLQELICMVTLTSMVVFCLITPTTLAASGFLQPALNFHYQPPEAKMDTTGTKTTTTTTTTTTTLTVDDTNVSFLFKLKVYPFRHKLFAAVTANNHEMMKATARFGGPETGVVKRPSPSGNNNNNGVVAFGVDLGLPGTLGGMGYGHQIPFSFPFETFSISSVQVRTESHLANNDISDDHAEY